MALAHVGAAVHEKTAATMLAAIRHADTAGVPSVWLTTGAGPDAMMVFASAASVTQRIRMGTAIVPTFPRHPVVVAQQAADIDSVAPGRFVLGVGPSHAPAMEGRYGIPYVKPLEHVREFVGVVKTLLAGGEVKFQGARIRAGGRIAYPANVPVITSALRAGSFELAGEIADGAVTWLCPAQYLRDIALPAMARGAAKAGRARPKLVAHAFLALTTDKAQLARGVQESLTYYPGLKNYQEMFVAAGLPEAREGKWSDRMVDACVLHGDAATCRTKVADFLALSGAEELILSVMAIGDDRTASVHRTLDFIAAL
jgi:alkanesulfonate monooxygenase SsuD/methylene tetrahydromethanopterin reductase-like flavin-dependent oxidoreductase (luciferase family)